MAHLPDAYLITSKVLPVPSEVLVVVVIVPYNGQRSRPSGACTRASTAEGAKALIIINKTFFPTARAAFTGISAALISGRDKGLILRCVLRNCFLSISVSLCLSLARIYPRYERGSD